jgi:hypothetical protein
LLNYKQKRLFETATLKSAFRGIRPLEKPTFETLINIKGKPLLEKKKRIISKTGTCSSSYLGNLTDRYLNEPLYQSSIISKALI